MLEKLSRRKFLQLSGFGATAAILAACAPGAAPQAGSDAGAAPAAAGTELIHWGRNPTEEEVVWKPIVALAKEMYPELNIVLQSPPEEMVQKLLIAFAGGTAPDMAVGGLSSFGGWIGINMINSLQSFIDADAEVQGWLPEYVPAALEGYSQQGQLYGVPTVNEGIMLWYHKDAILEAGLTPPAEIEDDPAAWNWNTVAEYALALNQGEGFRRDRFGIIATSNKGINGWSESWGNLVYANGGRFLDEARRRGNLRLARNHRSPAMGGRSDARPRCAAQQQRDGFGGYPRPRHVPERAAWHGRAGRILPPLSVGQRQALRADPFRL